MGNIFAYIYLKNYACGWVWYDLAQLDHTAEEDFLVQLP